MKATDSLPTEGCYFLEYWPIQAIGGVSHYQGTLRLDHHPAGNQGNPRACVISGDLYECPAGVEDCFSAPLGNGEDSPRSRVKELVIDPWLRHRRHNAQPQSTDVPDILADTRAEAPLPLNVPIFPRSRYASYLELTDLAAPEDSPGSRFSIPFHVHTYDRRTDKFTEPPRKLTFGVARQPSLEGLKKLQATRKGLAQAPNSVNDLDPSDKAHYWGLAQDAAGRDVAFFTLYHVADHFRRAIVEIDNVSDFRLADWQIIIGADPGRADTQRRTTGPPRLHIFEENGVIAVDEVKDMATKRIVGGAAAKGHLLPEMKELLKHHTGKEFIDLPPVHQEHVFRFLQTAMAPPLPSGADGDDDPCEWGSVFSKAGWEVTKETPEVITLDRVTKIKDDPGTPWTFAELHVAMQAFKSNAELDKEWRYHVLCVPELEGGCRGISYDVGLSAKNVEPRAGMAVASRYRFPRADTPPMPDSPQMPFLYQRDFWGDVAGKTFAEVPNLYFRTAVHEVGHLCNLGHNQRDTGFMNATNVIAYNNKLRHAAQSLSAQELARERLVKLNALPDQTQSQMRQRKPHVEAVVEELHRQGLEEISRRALRASKAIDGVKEFPDNVTYAFHPEDVERLRHSPDVLVRPGTAFSPSDTPLARHRHKLSKRAAGLQLEVMAQEKKVPLGAPVRLNFRITNTTHESSDPQKLYLPRSLSLKRGHVRGVVRDPKGIERAFEPLMVIDDHEYDIEGIDPGGSRAHSLSLLHGSRQSLFPIPGHYQISVEVEWELYGSVYRETGQTTLFTISSQTGVEITSALESDHRRACETLLNDPDTLIGFACRSSLNEDLLGPPSVLRTALSCSCLSPHYHIVRANQYFEKSLRREGSDRCRMLEYALTSIQPESILSVSEIWRVWRICWEAENGYGLTLYTTQRTAEATATACEKNRRVTVARYEAGTASPSTYYLFCTDGSGKRTPPKTVSAGDSDAPNTLIDTLNLLWEAPFVEMYRQVNVIREVMGLLERKAEIETDVPDRYEKLQATVKATKDHLHERLLALQIKGVIDYNRYLEDADLFRLLSTSKKQLDALSMAETGPRRGESRKKRQPSKK